MATNRLFFALLPNPDVREACSKAGFEINIKNNSNGRLTAPEDYHLTVLFLGDQVTPEEEAKALKAGSQIGGDPVEFVLDHASGFKESKVWWLGMSDIPDSLTDLRTATKDAVGNAGVTSDRRRFAPHVTVVRGAGALLPLTSVKPIKWRSEELVLMRSRLDANPRTYEIVGAWRLTGRKNFHARDQLTLI